MTMPLSAPAMKPWLLGRDTLRQRQVESTLFSASTYGLYGLILLAQVQLGLVSAAIATALGAGMLLCNLVFYAAVRSGMAARGPDPGLATTQMVVGIVFMHLGYATLGPAAPGAVIIMTSHVVYAMFWMSPRAVWGLVAVSLATLAANMVLCHHLWPERYVGAVQWSTFFYAALVVPTIALLAGRVAGMTQRLQTQRLQLRQALEELRELASRDELTRVHNRHHMVQRVAELRRHASAETMPLSLALIDIDWFKRVNDEHGHAMGDEVLRRFAALVKAELRSHDLVARWGGEEFLLALPDTPRELALEVLERLQRTLADPTLQAMPAGLNISFSAGLVQMGTGESLEAAVERADQAMYAAKRAGRARCVAA